MSKKLIVAYLILSFVLGISIGLLTGNYVGFKNGFTKHHSQVYVKYGLINRSLFTGMQNVGIKFTPEQAQDLSNYLKEER